MAAAIAPSASSRSIAAGRSGAATVAGLALGLGRGGVVVGLVVTVGPAPLGEEWFGVGTPVQPVSPSASAKLTTTVSGRHAVVPVPVRVRVWLDTGNRARPPAYSVVSLVPSLRSTTFPLRSAMARP
ncbi:hypothetical protein [Pengzhenrongella frigida]|uniref:Uncharacterized protein n=1 Tax=Pengzhenrongella frigida TaxID=1259133 RepID=A0A4Q5MVG3_9MICO|nr:hypothetical protein [Cellulomonas sp. HLT2-17]RYV49592.1 hypothetical protein EUA98_17850 [Cellulomonas sp. HLT2-17]